MSLHERIHEWVGVIYRAAREPAQWPLFLETLSSELRAPSLHLLLRVPRDEEPALALSVGPEASANGSYADAWAARDPVLALLHKTEENSAHPDHELVSETELSGSPFRREWMAPQGLQHGLCGCIHRPEVRPGVALRAFRGAEDGPFLAHELQLTRALLPHLGQAVALQRTIEDAAVVREAALDTLDRMPGAWLLVDERGQILERNRLAEALLERDDGLWIDAAGLRASSPAETSALRERVTRAARVGSSEGEPPPPLLFLSRPSGLEPLRVLVMPVRRPARLPGVGGLAVVLVGMLERQQDRPEKRLQQIYGFTPAEARVAARLADGRRLREIAEDLEVSINTVRGHLKQLFAKTGTHRQVELVRMLIGGASQLELE